MGRILIILLITSVFGCTGKKESVRDPQIIVDKSIEASGGELYRSSDISFTFREREYRLNRKAGKRVLMRITETDTARIEDLLSGSSFERRIDGQIQSLPDSTSLSLAEAVNSVHYFAYLPKGLNDAAVNKTYLGPGKLGDADYHKIQVTFDQEGGGTDFEDVFVYWFNTETFHPDYLAYEYHTNGGGKRFREAFNAREVGGIRFVDYRNYKYSGTLPVSELDSLFLRDELEFLSLIKLEKIKVTPGNYN
ncbi:DUF6503 family protein [Robiginitalea sp.]|uniref:DUF6503 family protein n=1 Tax=Robiginitalea sp. TaxID=1902411 RepID=UPI003C51D5D8